MASATGNDAVFDNAVTRMNDHGIGTAVAEGGVFNLIVAGGNVIVIHPVAHLGVNLLFDLDGHVPTAREVEHACVLF